MKYSIDTSAILDGWIRYYPPDVFPQVWAKLTLLIDRGDLRATEEVLFELQKKDDGAYRWAMDHHDLFVPFDHLIQIAVSGILAQHPRLVDQRRNRSGADPWVIALAQIHDGIVVTAENPSNALDKPRIPDICVSMSIRYVNLLGLFRDQQWVFH